MRVLPPLRPASHRVRAALVTAMISGACCIVGPAAFGTGAPSAVAATATTAYRPVTPCRLADTRTSPVVQAPSAGRIRVQVTGRCGVPATAQAAVLTVTATRPVGSGFLTAWPAGSAMPTASTVNFRRGEDRANGAIVTLGGSGAVDISGSVATDIVVDVSGWFEPVSTSASGRFVPFEPRRLFDSRVDGFSRPLAPDETIRIPLPADVPSDATALAVNVTTTGPNAPGFVTLHPWRSPRPEASALNTDRADQTRAAGVITPVDTDGLAVYSRAGGHVIVDVTGWFTGGSSGDGTIGLFVPSDAPARLADTRTADPVWPEGTIEVPIGIGGAAAVALNLTIVDAHAWGFLTAHAARTSVPGTSTVNAQGRGETAANFALVPTSSAGVGIVGSAGADFVADLAGWFVGDPVFVASDPPVNTRPPVCADGTSPADLTAFFASGNPFSGADYQRAFPLPDGRTLWLFQDVRIVSRGGLRFVHNAGLVQSGPCFWVLQGGTYTHPEEYLFASATDRFSNWFWPLAGDVGIDGKFHVFVAEMRNSGARYLDRVDPMATWRAVIDPADLSVESYGPATDPSPDLYGWSVASDAWFTYLYAHCYRQFGWDLVPFAIPPVRGHDWDCSDDVTVARVPLGQFDQPLAYWNGVDWGPDPAAAVSVMPTAGRMVNPSQVRYDDGRFIAVTKEGDWWGDTIYLDVAPSAEGPWSTYATIPVSPRCAHCNTYFAGFVPGRAADGQLVLGLSNNSFYGGFSAFYSPAFLSAPPPP